MVQLVREDAHARAAQRGQHAQVGGEPGREADGSLGPLPVGQLPLQLEVDGAAAGDQARGTGAGAPAGKRVVLAGSGPLLLAVGASL